MNNKNRNKRARKGFTLVEMILAMTISTVLLVQAVGVVNSVLRVNRNVLRDNLVESNMRNMVYNVSQILRTASVSFIVGPDKFDGESDASGITKKLTPGWNYLGVSSDKREFCLFKFVPVYKMDPTTRERVIDKENSYHQKQVLARSGDSDAADITFNFHVTGNEKERLLNFVLTENIKWQGENLKKQIDTSVYAMNSRNVNGAEGICVAYRNDPIEVDRASGEARFMLCLDVSGSMMYRMDRDSNGGNNNYTGTNRERMRIGHLENALTFLVDNLATNDLITLGMVSYSNNVTTVYYPNASSNLGQFKPTSDNPDTKEDPNADERYFTVVSNSIDDLKNNIIKQYEAKSQYGMNGERDMLYCGGGTNTGDAIRTGMAMLRKAEDNSRSKINHLILLTDGEPNIVNHTYHPDTKNALLARYSDDNSFSDANGPFWYYDTDDRNRCSNRLVSKGYTYDGDIVGGAYLYYNRPFPTYEEAREGNMQFYGVKIPVRNNTFRLTGGRVMNQTLKNVSNKEEYDAAVQSLLYGLVPEPYLPWVYGAIMANRNFDNAQDVFTGGKYRLGYYGTFVNWVLKRSADWCSEVFLKKNKESHKNPNGFIKKFHIIGFGPQESVKARCMEVVDAVNSGSGKELAVYYEGTDTESLNKIFDGIIKEINNDLWFVEGPKPVTPATPATP